MVHTCSYRVHIPTCYLDDFLPIFRKPLFRELVLRVRTAGVFLRTRCFAVELFELFRWAPARLLAARDLPSISLSRSRSSMKSWPGRSSTSAASSSVSLADRPLCCTSCSSSHSVSSCCAIHRTQLSRECRLWARGLDPLLCDLWSAGRRELMSIRRVTSGPRCSPVPTAPVTLLMPLVPDENGRFTRRNTLHLPVLLSKLYPVPVAEIGSTSLKTGKI